MNRLQVLTLLAACAATRIATADSSAADTTNVLGFQPGGTYAYRLDGAGVSFGVFEAGTDYAVMPNHQEFLLTNTATGALTTTSRITVIGSNIDPGSHATPVGSIIAGSGYGGSQYRGMAPAATIRSYGSGNFSGNVLSDGRTTATGLNPAKLDITNGSYSVSAPDDWSTVTWTISGVAKAYSTWEFGTTTYYRDQFDEDPRFGRYTSTSVAYDAALFDRPYVLSFFSAGNTRGNLYDDIQGDGKYVARFTTGVTPTAGVSLGNGYWLISKTNYALPEGTGYDTLASVGTTKNAVIVGATTDYTTDPHPKQITTGIITSFTNYGPTDDGRLGVTVMADGNGLNAAASSSTNAYTTTFSGTSASSPAAAGTAGIILQHWRNKTGLTPLAATQKALLIHTATDIASAAQVGPDYRTGYGLLNAFDAVDFIDDATQANSKLRTSHVIESSLQYSATTFKETDYYFFPVSPITDIMATLVWTDPEGAANSSTSFDNRAYRTLMNDLDLWITDRTGKIYYPWTLDPDNPSLPAVQITRNDVDNVEQVSIAASSYLTGSYFILHIGFHDTQLTGTPTQNYSLLVSGGYQVPEPTALAIVLPVGLLLKRRRRHERR